MQRANHYAPTRVTALCALAFAGAAHAQPTEGRAPDGTNGEYMVRLGNCSACHTGPNGPFLGGHVVGGGGKKTAMPNLTPDPETGIGKGALPGFVALMRTGQNGRHLFLDVEMPYPFYTKMTDADLADVYAHLRSLPPYRNAALAGLPRTTPAERASFGRVEGKFAIGAYQPDPQRSPEWNRGAYLVESVGHCGDCHSPATEIGLEDQTARLQGAPFGALMAPDLTSNAFTGLGAWTLEDIVAYLRTGANRFDLASDAMQTVVLNATQHLTDADALAIAIYLKDTPPSPHRPEPAALPADDARMALGRAVFEDRCSACHGPEGAGVPGLFPKLAGAPLVNAPDPRSSISVVLAGSQAVATVAAPTGPAMPALGWNLTDAQIAAAVTYIRNAWGNRSAPVAAETVAAMRAEFGL